MQFTMRNPAGATGGDYNATCLIFNRFALRAKTSSSVAMLFAFASSAAARCSASAARSPMDVQCQHGRPVECRVLPWK
jgi:hypothetical protein